MLAGVGFRISFLLADGIRAARPGSYSAAWARGARASIWSASVWPRQCSSGAGACRAQGPQGKCQTVPPTGKRQRKRQRTSDPREVPPATGERQQERELLLRAPPTPGGGGHKCAPRADSGPEWPSASPIYPVGLARASPTTHARASPANHAHASYCRTRRGSRGAGMTWLLLLRWRTRLRLSPADVVDNLL